jgi:hypothetical protein
MASSKIEPNFGEDIDQLDKIDKKRSANPIQLSWKDVFVVASIP